MTGPKTWVGCDHQGRNRVHFRNDDLRWTCFHGSPKPCPWADDFAPLCADYQKTSGDVPTGPRHDPNVP